MRILVLGATGLIGAAVVGRLLAEGHALTGIARSVDAAARRLPQVGWVELDISASTTAPAWLPVLSGIDAVVNCAGALQDGPRDSVRGVHRDGMVALFAACEVSGVRRVVQISAIGADADAPTAFLRTKHEADTDLIARDLDWVILRPSVVVGRAAFGGSALIRGLAALPVFPAMPGTGPLQIVQLDDIAATVLACLRPDGPTRVSFDLAGPEPLPFADVVRQYRRWLGWRDAPALSLPGWAAAACFRFGDLVSRLGWRPPMRSTAQREIARGSVGDSARWTELTGIRPRSLADALAAEPASVQEKWFAALYFVKPTLFIVLPLFWILTGLISLGPGYTAGVALMREAGAAGLAPVAVIGGALADIAIGIGLAVRPLAHRALLAAILLSLAYAAAATILLPQLWLDPLGPILKIAPILVAHLAGLAMLPER